MALYINGVVICNRSEDAFEIFSDLSSLPYMHNLENSQPREIDGSWHVSLNPKGISYNVPYDSDLDRQNYQNRSSEVLGAIYSELRKYQSIEIALIGEEILDRFYDKTETDLVKFGKIKIPRELTTLAGLVISNDIFESLENPSSFEKFSEHTYWHKLRN